MNNKTKQTSEEFNNFRELAKNLMTVPKKEIDRQKSAYDRKNKKR